jgi:serine/threonine protein phosphatase PrpC
MLRAAETIQRTDTGRQRRGNEDSSYARPPVFVIADGMGGAQAGEVASQIAVEAFSRGLPEHGTAEERLSVVVQRANREIYERAQTERDRAGMGTTLTAAYLDGDHVAIAHVGDSRAYLLRDGELTRLTEDHSLVEELLRGGKLTEQEALEHPQRSIITRALGPEPIVEVDTWSYPLRPGDVVLLCSDGLTSMIPEQQVQAALVESPSLQAGADRLIDEANSAGGRDNITVVLFRVEDADVAPIDQRTVITSGAGFRAGTVEDGGSSTPGGPATATAARPEGALPRLARTQGWVQPGHRPRHFGRLGKAFAGLLALAVVVFLVGGGGYIATRQLYFLGTNGQGTVVLYRGLPYVLPFGIPLYETYYVSGVPASTIPAAYRGTLLNHDLRSQAKGQDLVNDLELGKISG